MRVDIESIHLNHDPTFQSTGAISIRRNEKSSIRRPEWLRYISVRPEDAPAAYVYNTVRNRNVTIQAAFSCRPLQPTTIRIRALDGYLHPTADSFGSRVLQSLSPSARAGVISNALGSVAEGDVEFVNGQGKATFFLENVRIRDAGVDVSDVVWRWQFLLEGQDWTDITTTVHRIYTVVDRPSAPWQPESLEIKNKQLPWIEVLDFACRIAAGAKSLDEAATKITLWANGLGNQKLIGYDEPNGGPTFSIDDLPHRFDCSDFLLLLDGGPNLNGNAVNCVDCAAIVTTFSNVLGCRLSEGKMGSDVSFDLNRHLRIGLRGVYESNFGTHTVSWLGECTAEDALFDACVRLDLDDDTTTEKFTVPTNIVFNDYRLRLTKEPGKCAPKGKSPVRFIGLEIPPGMDQFEAALDRFEAAKTRGAKILTQFKELLTAKLIDFRFIETTNAQYLLQFFLKTEPEVSFGVNMYESEQGEAIPLLVESVLGRFNVPPKQVAENPPPFGSEAYLSGDKSIALFVRNEFVFLVRNTGSRKVSCEQMARQIDQVIMEIKKTEEREVRVMAQHKFEGEWRYYESVDGQTPGSDDKMKLVIAGNGTVDPGQSRHKGKRLSGSATNGTLKLERGEQADKRDYFGVLVVDLDILGTETMVIAGGWKNTPMGGGGEGKDRAEDVAQNEGIWVIVKP